MLVEIKVPGVAYPKKDPEHPCACQFREFVIGKKEGEALHWLVNLGDSLNAGDVVCEGEIEKKTLEFTAPCAGTLTQILLPEDSDFAEGDVLGLLETP